MLLSPQLSDAILVLELGDLSFFSLFLHLDLLLLLVLLFGGLARLNLSFNNCELALVLLFISSRELFKSFFKVVSDLLNNVLGTDSRLLLTLRFLLSTLFKDFFLNQLLLVLRKFAKSVLLSVKFGLDLSILFFHLPHLLLSFSVKFLSVPCKVFLFAFA